MRRKLVELDLVECVLGLGANLFYNSPMEACVVICRTRKAARRQGKILFIDAVHEVARERAGSFLSSANQERVLATYRAFANESGFSQVAAMADVLERDCNLSIQRYVEPIRDARTGADIQDMRGLSADLNASGRAFWQEMDAVVDLLDRPEEKGTEGA